MPFKLFDTVALNHVLDRQYLKDNRITVVDFPEAGLAMDALGTIVDIAKPGIYEVEFADDQGRTLVLLPFREHDLRLVIPSHLADQE